MLPKIIHYCWFGGKELPVKVKKCIQSWKKFFPDYKIKLWNEDNFDIKCCEFVISAYQNKNWAFVSDYARFKILYEYGGIYFDTDVEVIKSFEDIVANGAFMGCQKMKYSYGNTHDYVYGVAAGLCMGAYPKMSLYKKVLESFENEPFDLKSNGIYNKNIVERVTDIFKEYGYNFYKNEIQTVDNITIYSEDYFNPLDFYTGKLTINDHTRSIHHYDASWLKKEQKIMIQLKWKFYNSNKLMLRIFYIFLYYSVFLYNCIKTLGIAKTASHIKNTVQRRIRHEDI